jgi:hypothetical protein
MERSCFFMSAGVLLLLCIIAQTRFHYCYCCGLITASPSSSEGDCSMRPVLMGSLLNLIALFTSERFAAVGKKEISLVLHLA